MKILIKFCEENFRVIHGRENFSFTPYYIFTKGKTYYQMYGFNLAYNGNGYPDLEDYYDGFDDKNLINLVYEAENNRDYHKNKYGLIHMDIPPTIKALRKLYQDLSIITNLPEEFKKNMNDMTYSQKIIHSLKLYNFIENYFKTNPIIIDGYKLTENHLKNIRIANHNIITWT